MNPPTAPRIIPIETNQASAPTYGEKKSPNSATTESKIEIPVDAGIRGLMKIVITPPITPPITHDTIPSITPLVGDVAFLPM